MGSKKERSEKQTERLKSSQAQAPRELKQPQKPFSLGLATEPMYKAGLMVIAIIVIMFLLNFIINSVFTQIVTSQYSELANDSEKLLEKVQEYIGKSTVYSVLQRISLSLSGILALIFLFKRIEKTDLDAIGVKNKQKLGINIGLGALLGFVAILVVYNLLLLIGSVGMSGMMVLDPIQLLWTLEILFMCVFEEMFFRGYLHFKLGKMKPVWLFVISSVIFVLFKGMPSDAVGTYTTYALMNVFLILMYKQLKSPWFGVAFRFMWTFTSGIVLSIYSPAVPGIFELSHFSENILSGTKSGFENGIIASVVIVACYFVVRVIASGKLKPKEKYQRRLQKDGTIR